MKNTDKQKIEVIVGGFKFIDNCMTALYSSSFWEEVIDGDDDYDYMFCDSQSKLKEVIKEFEKRLKNGFYDY